MPIGVKATTCEALYCRDVPSICSHSRFAGYFEYPRFDLRASGRETPWAKRHGRTAEIAAPDDQRQQAVVAEDGKLPERKSQTIRVTGF